MGWENMDGLFWCAEKLHFGGGGGQRIYFGGGGNKDRGTALVSKTPALQE